MKIELDAPLSQIPHAGNWLGAWAMHEPSFHAMREQLATISVRAHLAEVDKGELLKATESRFSVTNGIGVINITGPMMKHASSFGMSCSTAMVRRRLSNFAADNAIRGVILNFETPGGTVAGTMELAEDLANFEKPTLAYCSDLTASAGYWVASQADSISANRLAMVGSIGVYTVVVDASAAAEDQGLKVHVIRTGDFKGAGTPGTEITEDQLAETQRLIDAIHVHFLDAVSRGRGLASEKLQAVSDGRVHMAQDAVGLGLVDQVETFEQAFERFEASLSQPTYPAASIVEESEDMANDNATMPATAQELKERFPKSSADWRLKAIEAGWTVAEATENYADVMQARAEAEEQRAEEAERRASKPGAKPVSFSGKRRGKFRAEDDPEMMEDEDDEQAMEDEEEDAEYEDSATASWNRELAVAMKRCGGNRMKALAMANRNNPGLRSAMVEEQNAIRRRRA